MPMSPLLSILCLTEYHSQQTCVAYADDQVFFGNEYFKTKDFLKNKKPKTNWGIVESPEKCRWVKVDGKWTEGGLKFLGFRLHEDGTFHSETRKGIVGQINWKILELYDPT